MSSKPGAAGVAAPPPGGKVSFRIEQLAKGVILHRMHSEAFPPASFNPGHGESRFAPFTVSGKTISTAYAATSLSCAIYETIFHDIDASAQYKTIPFTALESLVYSTLHINRPLRLAALFSADLMKFSLDRQQVIDTPRSGYPTTRLWSPAAHMSAADVDGMIWVSRKYDQERAMVLFGDRVTADNIVTLSSHSVTENSGTLETIFEFAQRSGITFID